MKKQIKIKSSVLTVAFVAGALIFAACENNEKAKNINYGTQQQNDSNSRNSGDDRNDDSEFLIDAAALNLEQIQLGKLAQQKGKASHVKELGKMMEESHTKTLNELKALAARKRVTLPNAASDDATDDFNKISIDDFDKAYANRMVNGHRSAISTFESAAEDSEDADIRNWASTTLPELRKHLDQAIASQKKFEDNMRLEKNNK
jgi:putative membrane protein